MIKLALPTRDNKVDDHFGHCESYTIASISDERQITNIEIIESPQGCGCKSNIASTLKDENVTLMLAGNIGQGAIAKLNTEGIEVIRGCSGNIEQVINDYLAGNIEDNGKICAQHDAHECSNH